MRFSEFLAEIKSSMKQYDSANLLNDLDIYTWMVQGLRRFGNLPTIQIEKSIEIKNRKASLPDGFKSLKLALKCDPFTYECDEKGRDVLQKTFFYKTTESLETKWDICDPCDLTIREKCITEKLYFHNGGEATFYYKNPEWLRLVSYLKKDLDTKGCYNLQIKSAPYEVSINNKTIYTNFNQGYVYMIYNGFPEDEEGFVEIPETNQGNLKLYLEYMVKRRIVEDIIGNGDNTNAEISMFQLYQQQELQYFGLAKTELKFKDIEIGLKNYQKKIKKEFKIYHFGDERFRRSIEQNF